MVFPATSVFIGVHPWFPFLPAQPESRAGVVVSPADPGGGTRALYGSQDGRRYFAPLCEPHPLTRSRDCGTTLSPIGREGRDEGVRFIGSEHLQKLDVSWGHEPDWHPSPCPLPARRGEGGRRPGEGRFMESFLSLLRTNWNHEPPPHPTSGHPVPHWGKGKG